MCAPLIACGGLGGNVEKCVCTGAGVLLSVGCMGAPCNKHVQTNLRQPPEGSLMVVFSCALAAFEIQGMSVFFLSSSHCTHTPTYTHLIRCTCNSHMHHQPASPPPTDFHIYTYTSKLSHSHLTTNYTTRGTVKLCVCDLTWN